MAIKQRLQQLVGKLAAPMPPPWRPIDRPYPLLGGLDPRVEKLHKTPGVLAVWHLGVRPQWLKIAACTDLGAAIESAAANAAIMSYAPNGGVYAAWAPLPPAAMAGPVVHLVAELRPALQSHALAGELQPKPDTKPAVFALPPGAGDAAR
jgi:hypothetical protein